MFRTLLRHGPQAGLTLIEQGFFSGANFAANVMLARWMSVGAYGETTLVLSLSLTVLLVYSNFMIEPMVVLGHVRFADSLPRYYRTLLAVHAALSILFSAICAVSAWLLADQIPGPVLWLLAGSTPFLLLIWLLRRLPYTESKPRIAAEISVIYALALIGLTFASGSLHVLSTATAVTIFSLASCLPLIRFRALLGNGSWTEDVGERPWLTSVLSEHWRFSRPLIAASLLCIPALNVQTVVTSYFLGVEEVGILRAVGIFIMPASILATATGNLVLSLMVRDSSVGNIAGLLRKVKIVTVGLTAATIVYCGLVFLFAPSLDVIFYAGKYGPYMWLTGLLGLIPIATAVGAGWTWALRAALLTRHVLVMTAIGAVVSVAASFVLIPHFGLAGAALSSLAAPLVYAATVFYVGRNWSAGARNET